MPIRFMDEIVIALWVPTVRFLGLEKTLAMLTASVTGGNTKLPGKVFSTTGIPACPDRLESLSYSCPDRLESLSYSCSDRLESLSYSCPDRLESLSYSCPDRLESLSYS